MRLIDGDALIAIFKEWHEDVFKSCNKGTSEEIACNYTELDVLEEVIRVVSNAPMIIDTQSVD